MYDFGYSNTMYLNTLLVCGRISEKEVDKLLKLSRSLKGIKISDIDLVSYCKDVIKYFKRYEDHNNEFWIINNLFYILNNYEKFESDDYYRQFKVDINTYIDEYKRFLRVSGEILGDNILENDRINKIIATSYGFKGLKIMQDDDDIDNLYKFRTDNGLHVMKYYLGSDNFHYLMIDGKETDKNAIIIQGSKINLIKLNSISKITKFLKRIINKNDYEYVLFYFLWDIKYKIMYNYKFSCNAEMIELLHIIYYGYKTDKELDLEVSIRKLKDIDITKLLITLLKIEGFSVCESYNITLKISEWLLEIKDVNKRDKLYNKLIHSFERFSYEKNNLGYMDMLVYYSKIDDLINSNIGIKKFIEELDSIEIIKKDVDKTLV